MRSRREAESISARKNSIIGTLVTLRSWALVTWKKQFGSAGLRDAAIGTGIAVDKMLALTGQLPVESTSRTSKCAFQAS